MARGASRPQCASMDTVMDLRVAAEPSRHRAAPRGAGRPRVPEQEAREARQGLERALLEGDLRRGDVAAGPRRAAARRRGRASRKRKRMSVRSSRMESASENCSSVDTSRRSAPRRDATKRSASGLLRWPGTNLHTRDSLGGRSAPERARARHRAHGDARRVQARRHDLQHLRRLVEGAHWPRRTDRAAPGPDARDKKAPRSTVHCKRQVV